MVILRFLYAAPNISLPDDRLRHVDFNFISQPRRTLYFQGMKRYKALRELQLVTINQH